MSAAEAVMRYTVIVLHPESNEPTALVVGEPVPDWAQGLVGDDDLEGGATEKSSARSAKK